MSVVEASSTDGSAAAPRRRRFRRSSGPFAGRRFRLFSPAPGLRVARAPPSAASSRSPLSPRPGRLLARPPLRGRLRLRASAPRLGRTGRRRHPPPRLLRRRGVCLASARHAGPAASHGSSRSASGPRRGCGVPSGWRVVRLWRLGSGLLCASLAPRLPPPPPPRGRARVPPPLCRRGGASLSPARRSRRALSRARSPWAGLLSGVLRPPPRPAPLPRAQCPRRRLPRRQLLRLPGRGIARSASRSRPARSRPRALGLAAWHRPPRGVGAARCGSRRGVGGVAALPRRPPGAGPLPPPPPPPPPPPRPPCPPPLVGGPRAPRLRARSMPWKYRAQDPPRGKHIHQRVQGSHLNPDRAGVGRCRARPRAKSQRGRGWRQVRFSTAFRETSEKPLVPRKFRGPGRN